MDPFSRKLFKNSDARQRLAQMGGIVASSPELASTVQRFQTGGDVTGLPPELLSSPSVQRLAARQGLSPAEYLMSLSPEALAATMSQVEAQTSFGPTPDAFSMGLAEAQTSFGPTQDAFSTGLAEAQTSFGPTPVVTPAEDIGLGLVSEEGFSERTRRSQRPRPEGRSAATQYLHELFNPGEYPPTGGGRGRSMLSEPEETEVFDLEEAARADAEARAEERAAAGIDRSLTEDERAESLRAEPDSTQDDADPMSEAADTTAAELRDIFGIDSPDRAPRNRRERIEQELELIKDVFGHRNKDEARERAMNLAMIGLAIAAGQSPNALTNIAQGALAGTQAMQRAQAAERDREDALRMQAYESVLGEEREERQFGRQVQLAQFKASLAGPASSGTTTPTDPGNLFTTELNRVLGAGLDTPIGMRIAEIEDPAEKEAFALETALQNVLTVSPADTEVDVARMREVEQRVRDRIARLRGADASSLSPAQSVTLDAARQSLERNSANRAAIESRLRSVGIDPSLL